MSWVGPVLCSAGLFMGQMGTVGTSGSRTQGHSASEDSGAIAGVKRILGRLRSEPENKTVMRKTNRRPQSNDSSSSSSNDQSSQSNRTSRSSQTASNGQSSNSNRSSQSHANSGSSSNTNSNQSRTQRPQQRTIPQDDAPGLLGRLFGRDDHDHHHHHHHQQQQASKSAEPNSPQDSPNKIRSSSSLVITPVEEEEPLRIRKQATPRSAVSPTIRRKVESSTGSMAQEQYQPQHQNNYPTQPIQIRTPVVVAPVPMILPTMAEQEPMMPAQETVYVEPIRETVVHSTRPTPSAAPTYSGPIIAPTRSPSTAPTIVYDTPVTPQPTVVAQPIVVAQPMVVTQPVVQQAAPIASKAEGTETMASAVVSAAESLGDVQLVSAQSTENAATTAETSSGTYDGMGHADNYRWIQGRLQYVHSRGGAWLLRYAPLDVTDQYGGSMVLKNDGMLSQYKEGDRVRVEGEIISERTHLHVGGPLYLVRNIVLLESASE